MKRRAFRRQLRRRKYEIQKLCIGPDDVINIYWRKPPPSPAHISRLLKCLGELFPGQNNRVIATVGVNVFTTRLNELREEIAE